MPETELPTGLDSTIPSVARVYDALLGQRNCYAVDRTQAAELITVVPDAERLVRLNRFFLARTVRYLADTVGINQFLEIGSGFPTIDNVHQIAQKANPAARVVYVDNDVIVVSHGKVLLADNPQTSMVNADLRYPETILNHPEVIKQIDFNQPTALLLVGILHFFPGDEPYEIVERFTDSLAAGSHLVISHGEATEQISKAAKIYRAAPATPRPRDQIERFFRGWHLISPGIVPLPLWRPDLEYAPNDAAVPFLGGVANRPEAQHSNEKIASKPS